MLRLPIAALAWLGLALLPSLTAAAQPAQGPYREQLDRDSGFRIFLQNLQRGVRTNDRAAVLRLISYPLRVNDRRRDQNNPIVHRYRNAGQVRAHYDRIFTPAVRRAILAQSYAMLWGNWQGYMIGDGTVWFDRLCLHPHCRPAGPVRIVTINLI
jgi:hypothetical protein